LDFFTVPTVTFRVRYGFLVIEHQRRTILHCQRNPTSDCGISEPAAKASLNHSTFAARGPPMGRA
jgi:hypothetical protein